MDASNHSYNIGANDSSIWALAFDEKDNPWIGTDEGLSTMDADGKWTTYTTTNSGLNSELVQALLFDEKGNLWVGGDGGLSMLAPDGKWTTYTITTSDLIASYVN